MAFLFLGKGKAWHIPSQTVFHNVCSGTCHAFFVFAELDILRHVAYAYGVLPSTCSPCRGGGMVFCLAILLYSLY